MIAVMANRRVLSYLQLLGPLVVLGWGVFFAYVGVRIFADWVRLDSYVQTTGAVHATDIQVSGHDASFTPVVWYDYSVGGQPFTGSRIQFTPIYTHSMTETQSIISLVTAVTPLPVWYDPSSPEHSVLSKAYEAHNLVWAAIMPGVLLPFGGFLAFVMVRGVRSRTKSAVQPAC